MAFTDLEQAVKEAVANPGRRTSVGGNVVWGADEGIPVLLPTLVAQQEGVSLSFYSLDVEPTGTPAALVARGGVKPTSATVAVSPRRIPKYAGSALIAAEDHWEAEGAAAGVANTLLSQAYVALDTDANAALAAAAGAAVPGGSWVGAISAGQAMVNAAGGRPSIVVIPAADWAAVATEIAAAPGLGSPASDTMLTLLGSRVVLSPKGTGAFVVDPAACTTVTRDRAVLCNDDGSNSNQFRIVVDLVAGFFVTRAAGIAAISGAAGP